MGSFASERLPVGRLLPLKGPWYQPLPYAAMVAMTVQELVTLWVPLEGWGAIQKLGAAEAARGVVELQKLVDMSMDYESRAVVVRVASSDERVSTSWYPLLGP